MDVEQEIPQRSKFWFTKSAGTNHTGRIFDWLTLIYSIVLALFTFILFWPIIAQIEFNEAFYTPLVPFLIFISSIFKLEVVSAMRIIFAVSLAISTIGIYLFVKELTKRQITPILAALIYLIPPVPIFILTYLRRGLYEMELASAKSFLTIIYGDGAHLLALALIPYTAIFFLGYLKNSKNIWLVLSVIIAGLILLTNRLQALNLFIVLVILALTEFFLEQKRDKFAKLVIVVFLALGLVSFWYTPDYLINSLFVLADQLIKNIQFLLPIPLIIAIVGLFIAFIFFARRIERQPIFISFLLFVIFLSILLGWYISGQSLILHPHRLFANLNMFGAIVLALILSAIIDKLDLVKKFNFQILSSTATMFIALAFGLVSFVLLTIVAYLVSPLTILGVSGPQGIWTVVRENVLVDRAEAMTIAGGSYKLLEQQTAGWQLMLGTVISLGCLGFLIYLIMRNYGKVADRE